MNQDEKLKQVILTCLNLTKELERWDDDAAHSKSCLTKQLAQAETDVYRVVASIDKIETPIFYRGYVIEVSSHGFVHIEKFSGVVLDN